MTQVRLERVTRNNLGYFARIRRVDDDGVEHIRWFGPFPDADALASWFVVMESETANEKPVDLAEIGLPTTLKELAPVAVHAAACARQLPAAQQLRDRLRAELQMTEMNDESSSDRETQKLG